MQENGYAVQVENVDNPTAVKSRYNIPFQLQGCHTAIVDGYVIEGHVPVAEVERLLAERPDVAGLAVPGMPVGSPGMEVASGEVQPYDVLMFDESGQVVGVFASYSN